MTVINLFDKEKQDIPEEKFNLAEEMKDILEDPELGIDGAVLVCITSEGQVMLKIMNLDKATTYMILGVAKQEILEY